MSKIYEQIPQMFRKKDTKGLYLPMYIQYWIDYVAQKKGISNGELISELIISQKSLQKNLLLPHSLPQHYNKRQVERWVILFQKP